MNQEERKENVRGAFKVKGEIQEKHLVIVDDILTTGATILECAKVLYQAGASRVTAAVLAFNQFRNPWLNKQGFFLCDICNDGFVRPIFNRFNEMFFGCSNYHEKNCTNSKDFIEGRRLLNIENNMHFINNIQREKDSWLF